MRILLDECLPKDLKLDLVGHHTTTVGDMDWRGIKNGQLLTLAEQQFEVFLTADRNIEYQQNMRNRQIVLVVLIAPDNTAETLRPLIPFLLEALPTLSPGVVTRISSKE